VDKAAEEMDRDLVAAREVRAVRVGAAALAGLAARVAAEACGKRAKRQVVGAAQGAGARERAAVDQDPAVVERERVAMERDLVEDLAAVRVVELGAEPGDRVVPVPLEVLLAARAGSGQRPQASLASG